MVTLSLVRQNGTRLVFPITSTQIHIGRHQENDLVFDEPEISRRHAVLTQNSHGDWFVTDLTSGRTRINGQIMGEKSALRDHDTIQIGPWRLIFSTQNSFVGSEDKTRLAGSGETQICDMPVLASEQKKKYRLVIAVQKTKTHFDLDDETVILGSSKACDVSVEDPYVSARHCQIKITGGLILLRDLGSTNGTWVGGVRVEDVGLNLSQPFQIGKTQVWVESCATKAAGPEQIELFYGMVGKSAAMRELYEKITMVAPSDMPVIICGPTGTGKELVARAVHDLSERHKKPFCVINCAAIPRELVESELFGHARGAFTGAVESRLGVFEEADQGTLFLDEIGELPLELQAKLLRVLETGMIRPVGSNRERKINVRVVSATHQNLHQMVQDKKFREDLFYRLFVAPLKLLPLVERSEDIELLCVYFLQQISSGQLTITDEALAKIKRYSWPGNIRELRHTLWRASIFCSGGKIHPEDIVFPEGTHSFVGEKKWDDHERDLIVRSLAQHEGNKAKAAESLGIAKSTLFRKINEYRIGK